jgi:hypothetical protein
MQILGGLYSLSNPSDPNSEFANDVESWFTKFFPEEIPQQ